MCRISKQRRFFIDRIAGGKAFKGIPQHRVAERHLVDWEIALEHAAAGAEGVDAGVDVWPPGGGKFFR